MDAKQDLRVQEQELTEQYKGKQYRRPGDKVVTIVSVSGFETDYGDRHFNALFTVNDPDPETEGIGHCALDVLLKTWKEIE